MYLYMSIQFGSWLQDKVDAEGITLADVAKRGNTSATTIWRIAKGERNVGVDSIMAIAQGLRMSPVEVFKIATNQPKALDSEQNERLLYLFNQLDETDQATIMQMMEFLLSK